MHQTNRGEGSSSRWGSGRVWLVMVGIDLLVTAFCLLWLLLGSGRAGAAGLEPSGWGCSTHASRRGTAPESGLVPGRARKAGEMECVWHQAGSNRGHTGLVRYKQRAICHKQTVVDTVQAPPGAVGVAAVAWRCARVRGREPTDSRVGSVGIAAWVRVAIGSTTRPAIPNTTALPGASGTYFTFHTSSRS